jgi:hypothetical protein
MNRDGADRLGKREAEMTVCAAPRSREASDRDPDFRAKYYALLERVAELGMVAIGGLTERQRYALEVVSFLREKHGGLKISSTSLYTLKKELKWEGMDYLNTILGNNPRRKDIVHEVFREPRMRRRPGLEEFTGEIP